MKIGIVCKVLVLATFLGLAVFSGIFVLVDRRMILLNIPENSLLKLFLTKVH